MYSRMTNGWLKHWDFILLDFVMLQISYVFSCMIRQGMFNPYQDELYLNIGMIIGLADICTAFFMEPYHGIMRRGYFQEFKNAFRHVFVVGMLETAYLFLSKNADAFSRLSFLWFFPTAVILTYLARIIWKHYLIKHKQLFYSKVKMLLVTTREQAADTLKRMEENCFNEFEIIGVALTGGHVSKGDTIRDVPVTCSAEAIPDYIQTRWVDAVMINVDKASRLPEHLIDTCINMGLTVHYHISDMGLNGNSQYFNRMGGMVVLTTCLKIAQQKEVLMKRILDICGGVVGMILTAVITVFLAPAIFIASPGPVFFSQTRVGKNGKRFKIYKFRSMYMDAEKRKKDLMEKNEMQGFMFKMENDPRIIGSGPDGTRHGLGWFIRKTSLDEFPQFWNVLKGDMSLVGTRPPTEDEWKQYSPRHRARLAIKPGLTGMWQVSGRSNITDFDEVVKLDMEYIKNWTFGMDIKIILKTVWVVLRGRGSK